MLHLSIAFQIRINLLLLHQNAILNIVSIQCCAWQVKRVVGNWVHTSTCYKFSTEKHLL